MRAFFFLGWILIIAAFASAATEQLVRNYPGNSMFITPAYELWHTLWPGSLTIMQIRIERITPYLWDPVLTFALSFPAWFLLGLPGAWLAWRCREGWFLTARQREEYRKHVEAMLLFDELAKDAERQGYTANSDDVLPDYGLHEALAAEAGEQPVLDDDEMMEAIIAARKSANIPPGPN